MVHLPRRPVCTDQGSHSELTQAVTVLSKAVFLRQLRSKAGSCSVHGGHSCQARLVQGLGDRHCGSLGAVTVTALVVSEAGTFPTLKPCPVGSADHVNVYAAELACRDFTPRAWVLNNTRAVDT